MQEHSKDNLICLKKLSSNTMSIKHYENKNQKAKEFIKQNMCRGVSFLFDIYKCSSIWIR